MMMTELNESLEKGVAFIRNKEAFKGKPLLEELSMGRHIKPLKTLPALQKIDVEAVKSSDPKKKLRLKSKLRRKLTRLKRMAYTGMIVLPLVICIFLLNKALFDILSMYSMAVSFFSS